MICPSCKQEINDTARYCVYCGSRVGNDDPSASDGVSAAGDSAAPEAGGTSTAGIRRVPPSWLPMGAVAVLTSIVAVVSLVWGIVSWRQQHAAEQKLHELQSRESVTLANQAQDLLARGDRLQALQVAMAALPSAEDADRPVVASARLALEQALQVYPSASTWPSCLSTYGASPACSLTGEGVLAVAQANGRVRVSRLPECDPLCEVDAARALGATQEGGLGDMGLQVQGDLLLARSQGSLALFDMTSGATLWTATVDGLADGSDVTFSHDRELLALGTSHGNELIIGDDRANSVIVRLVSTQNGSVSQAYKLPLRQDMEHVDEVRMAFSPDDSCVVAGNGGRIWKVDLATGAVSWVDVPFSRMIELEWVDEQILAMERGTYSYDPFTSYLRTEAFASELYQLWSHEEQTDAEATAELLGTIEGPEDTRQLALLANGTVRLLDVASGEELRRVEAWSPITDGVLDGTWLVVVDESGAVCSQDLGDEDGSLQALGMEVDARVVPRLAVHDGVVLLSAYDALSQTNRTYRRETGMGGLDGHEMPDGDGVFGWAMTTGSSGQGVLVGCDDKRVVAIDASSYERIWRRKLTKVDERLVGEVACFDGERACYLCRKAADGAAVVYALSADDGSLLHTYDLGEGWGAIWQVCEATGAQGPMVAVRGARSVALFDADTEELQAQANASTGQTAGMWVAGDALLLLETISDGSGAVRLTAHALADGSNRELPESLTPLGGAGADLRVAVSPDQSRLVVGAADGILRCFDLEEWDFLWAGEAGMRPAHALAFAPDGERLLVQDDEGTWKLVSSEDATVLATDAASLPLASSLGPVLSGDQLCVGYVGGDGAGMAAVSLDEGCFGVVDDVPRGVWFAPDGSSVLAQAADGTCWRYRRYTIDELLDLGELEATGYELGPDERRMLRIE